MGKLINIDNGGTLTDIWILDGEKSFHTKTITTPYDLSKCFFEGLKKAAGVIYGDEDVGALLQSTDHIRYSTTQGSNALIMKKGPRLGLVVSKGFDIGGLRKAPKENEMFEALVGPRVEHLDTSLEGQAYDQALADTVNRLSSEGANRIIVSFNGQNYLADEARFRRTGLSLFPRHLLGAVPILFAGSLSGDQNLARRTWTAINNSFLHPAMERFLYNAEKKLRAERFQNPLLIYRNDGYSGRVAKTVALKTYSSGPRGGMESAKVYAEYYGFDRYLTMDVGGTTTDIGMVENGEIRALDRGAIERVDCSFALCDIVSIGIGGGSVFRVERGAIKVGPNSVGGAPGPACFGMGGKEATMTDALLLMGLLDPQTYFGGEMKLDKARARSAIQSNVADPLNLSVEQTIHAMLEAWAKNIADGLADFCSLTQGTVLSAFGGGGPMGVLSVAEAAGLNKVLVPRLSAVFSAHGIGFSDIAHSHESKLTSNDPAGLEAALDTLRVRVSRDMFSEGFCASECCPEMWLTINGTKVELDNTSPSLPTNVNGKDEVIAGLRLVATVNRAELPRRTETKRHEAQVASVRTLISSDGSDTETPVYKVEDQAPGASGQGPAVIEEAFWTCRVLPGWSFEFTVNRDVLFTRNC